MTSRSWQSAAFWMLIALIIVLFAIRNLPWHLDDFDQAKQAYASWEMTQTGNWFYQHTPLQRVATKPPLAGWISAGIYAVSRNWDIAWRLPSFLAAMTLLWLLARAGWELWETNGATIAVGAFALCGFTPRLATLVRTDMLLTLFICAAGLLIWWRVREAAPWTGRDRWLLAGLVLGSMLTKGPILYVFLLPGVLLFWMITRRRGQNFAWSGWWPWLLPLVVFAIWTAGGIWMMEGFYEQVVLREFAGRFEMGEEAVHKNQPVYFYVTHIFGKWAPWSVALLALLALPKVRAALRDRPDLLWLACWAGAALCAMSLVPSKRPDRIFPVIPPLALLLVGLAAIQFRDRAAGRYVAAVVVLALLGSGGYAVGKMVAAYHEGQGELPAFSRRVLAQFSPAELHVVRGREEGMLLYLHELRFSGRDEAMLDLEQERVRAVVMSEKDWSKEADRPLRIVARSHEALPKDEREKIDSDSRYVLVVRNEETAL
jgi:4-amino-4-deoxy-L-arabinose transferase-like glycosyltransferase